MAMLAVRQLPNKADISILMFSVTSPSGDLICSVNVETFYSWLLRNSLSPNPILMMQSRV